MGHKMKGMQFGAPKLMESKHGTNPNYEKSGVKDKNGAPFNFLDPLGLAKKAKGLFGRGKKNCPPAGAPPVVNPAAVDNRDAATANVDPSAAIATPPPPPAAAPAAAPAPAAPAEEEVPQ